ncbi:MAG: MBL fold metallo-hydrolase [Rhizobiaceae bacterium]|nr:MBL fold metallo-hydrolase [Rhizobiaceae bacterium]
MGEFRFCIHRGTEEIGGSCVELAFAGKRLLVDLGMPLDADDTDGALLLPDVSGLRVNDPNLLALILSHSHADHWGLTSYAESLPAVFMGDATRRILHAASAFVPRALHPVLMQKSPAAVLRDREPIQIGPFQVTPFLVDHSAYDAYALLVEAGGRHLFYSGDFRGHGRKSALFEKLLRTPPHSIDTMLMEGSSFGRLQPNQQFERESQIEEKFVTHLSSAGFVAVCASAQNIDRIVSLYRACKQTGRTLILDLYAAEILKATGNAHIPQAGWPNIAIYIPHYQRVHIKTNSRFDLLEPYKETRIFPEYLSSIADEAVMLFRPAMFYDLDQMRIKKNARAIWSQWSGYLEAKQGSRTKSEFEKRGIPMESIHTSGHASISDLKRLAEAIEAKALVPIHTFHGDAYVDHFKNTVRVSDGEWSSV